jgi:hypothetical protein
VSIVRLAVIRCDTCGKNYEVEGDNTEARVKASTEGWKFMSYTGLSIPGSSKLRSRLWDSCPGCPLPPPAQVIKLIVEEAQADT